MTGTKLNLSRACAKADQLFVPLGHHRNRFFFRAHGATWWWTSGDLCRLGSALTLLPDIRHWRGLYPMESGRPGAVDWEAAGADLIRMAQTMGEYQPPDGVGPRPVGRPRRTDRK